MSDELSSSLSELRRQRERLDADIARREAELAIDTNERLDQLSEAVCRFAEQHGGWTSDTRKNVTSITVNGTVTVQFGAVEAGRSGHLVVHDRGMKCTFDGDALPTTAGLLGLIAGQLDDAPGKGQQ